LSNPINFKIRFLGDPTGEFTKALDLGFEAYAVFGGMRGKRYALKVEDGKVTKTYVEPDNTGSAGKQILHKWFFWA
jgi:2-Cys peroxiredoxin 5